MKWMKRVTAGLITLLAVGLTGCASSGSLSGSGETRLYQALNKCGDVYSGIDKVDLTDSDNTLVVNGATSHKDIREVACILDHLGTSGAVRNELAQTTALMGRQSDESDGLKYEWSYHPDNGLDLIITET